MSRERERRDGGRGDERGVSLVSMKSIEAPGKSAVSLRDGSLHHRTPRARHAPPRPSPLSSHPLRTAPWRLPRCSRRSSSRRRSRRGRRPRHSPRRRRRRPPPSPRARRFRKKRRRSRCGRRRGPSPNPARRFRTADARGASRARRGRRRASLHPPSSAERPPFFPPRTAVFFDAPGPQRLPSQALEQLPQSFVCIDDLQQAGISATDIKARVATRVVSFRSPRVRPPPALTRPLLFVHPRRKSRRRATAPSSPS